MVGEGRHGGGRDGGRKIPWTKPLTAGASALWVLNGGWRAEAGAQGYWAQLLSGNRPALQKAVAPEANAIQAAGDAQRRQQATMGTARGGGVAALNQTADTARAAQIDNLLFGAQEKAAVGEAELGSREVKQAIAELGVAGNAAANLTAISADSRKTSIAANNQIQAQIGGLIEGALGAFA